MHFLTCDIYSSVFSRSYILRAYIISLCIPCRYAARSERFYSRRSVHYRISGMILTKEPHKRILVGRRRIRFFRIHSSIFKHLSYPAHCAVYSVAVFIIVLPKHTVDQFIYISAYRCVIVVNKLPVNSFSLAVSALLIVFR